MICSFCLSHGGSGSRTFSRDLRNLTETRLCPEGGLETEASCWERYQRGCAHCPVSASPQTPAGPGCARPCAHRVACETSAVSSPGACGASSPSDRLILPTVGAGGSKGLRESDCSMAHTSGILSHPRGPGSKSVLDHREPSGNLGVGSREPAVVRECRGPTPWEAVGCGMFWPAHHWPSLQRGSESKMGPLIPHFFSVSYPSRRPEAEGEAVSPCWPLKSPLSRQSAFLRLNVDGHSLHIQTSLTELTFVKGKKEKKEEKAAFCKNKQTNKKPPKNKKTTLYYKYLLGWAGLT